MLHDRRSLLALTGALLAGAAGCTSDRGNGNTSDESSEEGPADVFDEYEAGDFPQLNLVTDPDVETAPLGRQVRGNVDFSLAVLKQLREETPDENLCYSPYSISVALAMTYAGARGETATEMADALRYELEGDDLHAAFGALEDEFERRNEDGAEVETSEWAHDDEENGENNDDEDELGFQLSSANAVWIDEGFSVDPAYVDLLETYYEAGDHFVDFSGSPDEARAEINTWVEDRTNDRIEDLLPEPSVRPSTQLVLTNAVYFLAAWEHDFDPARTEPAPFTGLDGAETDVEMMHQTAELQYAEIGGHQLVELPYANGETSMVVVLPADGEFEAFEDAFSTERLAILLEEASRAEVELAFPKFEIESKWSLVETLQNLGMERTFDGGDFSGMLEGDDSGPSIDDIVHQSFAAVDEEGTEAAAATAVGMVENGEEVPKRVEMTVDRPFLFYVRDRPTEIPLFVGRVVDGETLQDD